MGGGESPLPGFNGVIDLSHHNAITDWASVRDAGIVAVIHKATEGATFRDRQFRDRRDAARSHGLLWGSYHFASGLDPADQVANYLDHAEPAEDELVCLDYEPSTAGADMSYDQIVEFVELIHSALGRYPVIYGGHLLREATKDIAGPSVLGKCGLWYARYAPAPIGVPHLWRDWTLWQYTDGKDGPEPHSVPGIGPCDRDTFNGSEADLRAEWPL